MVLEDNLFEDLTEKQIILFKKILEDNDITYEVMSNPYDRINNITYEAKSYEYKNFNEFIDDLNSQYIAEVYLYKVCISSKEDSGELSYKIRYTSNKDLIKNKTIKDIKKLIGTIKSNKNVQSISVDKIRNILEKRCISEEASRNIVKLIRILEKELNKSPEESK